MGGCRGNHVPLELQYFIVSLLEQTPTSMSFKNWASRRGDSGKSRLGPVSQDPGRLEQEHRLFCPCRFYGAAVFLQRERRGVNETNTFRA
jgi:hypothetical protein